MWIRLWVADITYIRMEEEFVFLAVILDAYSKRVIGWHLDDGLDDSLTLTALCMALRERTVRPGLVHHSDRRGQYASGGYTDLLKDSLRFLIGGAGQAAQMTPIGAPGRTPG